MSDDAAKAPIYATDPQTGKHYRIEEIAGSIVITPGGQFVLDLDPETMVHLVGCVLDGDTRIRLGEDAYLDVRRFGDMVELGSDDPQIGRLWVSLDALRVCTIRPGQLQKRTEVPFTIAQAGARPN